MNRIPRSVERALRRYLSKPRANLPIFTADEIGPLAFTLAAIVAALLSGFVDVRL